MRVFTIMAIVVWSFAARADEADDKFKQATEAKQRGDKATACKLYQQAWELNQDAVGTILNVAQCAEDAGRPHTALELFRKLEGIAREHSFPEYLKTAEEHIAKLKDQVAKLALSFDEKPDADTKVTIDGEPYRLDKGYTLEVNAGQIHLLVSHPDRVAFTETIEIGAGETKGFNVKALRAPVTVTKTRRNIGIVVSAIGGASLVTGGILAIVAKHEYDTACHKYTKPDGTVIQQCNDSLDTAKAASAIKLGDFATGLVIGGAVAAVVGGYLWFFAPKDRTEKVSIVPILAPDQAGVLAVGRF